MTTSAPAPAPRPASPPPPGLHLAALWLVRLVMLPQALLFILQPISIGSFLQGTWEALDVHLVGGGLLVVVTWLTGVCGLALAALVRRPWPAVGVVVLAVLTTVQVALGSTRVLALHVPLGVALVALAVGLAVWPWTRSAR